MEARIVVSRLRDDLTVDPSASKFVIAGEDAGGLHVHLASEMSGLADPVVEANTKSPGGRPGQRLLSTRFTARNVVFRVTILGDPDNIYQRESAWRSAWSYTSYTELAYTVNGVTRVIRLRLEDYEVDTNHDLAVQGAVDVVMSTVADDPFWYEPDELKFYPLEKEVVRKVKFHGEHAPVFPVFRWTAGVGSGYQDAFRFQVDGGQNQFFVIPDLRNGSSYLVDFDPGARQWQSKQDPNVWNRMNGVRYSLAGTQQARTLEVSHSMSDKVEVQMAAPYLRPWR